MPGHSQFLGIPLDLITRQHGRCSRTGGGVCCGGCIEGAGDEVFVGYQAVKRDTLPSGFVNGILPGNVTPVCRCKPGTAIPADLLEFRFNGEC